MQRAAERAQRDTDTSKVVSDLYERVRQTEDALQQEKRCRENDQRAREAEKMDLQRVVRVLENDRDEARAECEREQRERARDARDHDGEVRKMEDAVEKTRLHINAMVVREAELEAGLKKMGAECAALRAALGDADKVLEEKETQAVTLRGKVSMPLCVCVCMHVYGCGER
jgi:hypothetical protein